MGIGFLVMAFDKNNDAQPTTANRDFSIAQRRQINELHRRCPGNKRCTSHRTKWNYTFLSKIIFKDAATHTFNNEKQLVTVEWIPPLNYLGTVVFRWASLLHQHTVETEYANTNVFCFISRVQDHIRTKRFHILGQDGIDCRFFCGRYSDSQSQPAVGGSDTTNGSIWIIMFVFFSTIISAEFTSHKIDSFVSPSLLLYILLGG